MKETRNERHL